MIPSQTWFPTSLAEQAAWYLNFDEQFQIYAPALGLSAEIIGVTQDTQDFLSIAETSVEVRNFERAVIAYRKELTEGNIGDPQPVFPTASFGPTPNDRPAGMFQRLVELRARILAAPAYTTAMGEAMNIIGSGSPDIDASSVQPTIQLFAASSGYVFSIVVTKRGNADSWIASAAPVGTTDWQQVAFATGKSADAQFSGTGQPVQLQVRVQLRKNNADYGDPSMIGLVTVNP